MSRTSKPESGHNVSNRVFPCPAVLRFDLEDRVLDALRRIETLAALLSAATGNRAADAMDRAVVAEAAEMIAEESRQIREAITK